MNWDQFRGHFPVTRRWAFLDHAAVAPLPAPAVASLSIVVFASGFRNDLDALGALCRERGVSFSVDAIQGLGVLPLDVRQTPIDFLAADSHKWLLGPEGIGIFWVRPELIDML